MDRGTRGGKLLAADPAFMKTVFLGQSAPLDTGKSEPAVTINSSGAITLVHTEGATMYHRFGTCRRR